MGMTITLIGQKVKTSRHRKMAKKYAKKEIANKEKEHRQCDSQIHAGKTVPLDY